ncbi:MAG: PIG-L family deacetylase [Acidobacteriota bacterium]|nr:PIG-L family deacetylase [Acidobacteriota bacterium]
MSPYHHFVSELDRLVREGRRLPLGGFPAKPRAAHAGNAPRVLIFSPHPDDECIIGGFALRLLREAGMRVLNVAVTQGSRQDRQAARWDELQAACGYLGFGLISTGAGGLQNINVRTRAQAPARWQQSVSTIAAILSDQQPAAVLFPHDADWNSTHVGTHHLLMDALGRQAPEFSTFVVETEFWGGQMFASWNQIADWVRRIDALRQARYVNRRPP